MSYATDIVVKESNIHGLGNFANRDFSLNERIMVFEGNPKNVIYFNHSCTPNAYVLRPDEDNMQTHILYSNGIKKGEEITIDYRIGKLYKDLWEKTIGSSCHCPEHKRTYFFANLVEKTTNKLHSILSHFISEEKLLDWKPVHLCWWFEKHGLPIPKYFIGLTTTSTSTTTSHSTSSTSSSTSTSHTTSSSSSTSSTSSSSSSSTSTTTTIAPITWNNYWFVDAKTNNAGIISVTEKIR